MVLDQSLDYGATSNLDSKPLECLDNSKKNPLYLFDSSLDNNFSHFILDGVPFHAGTHLSTGTSEKVSIVLCVNFLTLILQV